MANQDIKIYINSCGKKTDQDFRWKLIINDNEQPLETPELLTKEITNSVTQKKCPPVAELIFKPESHSLALARQDKELFLLLTGFDAPDRTKEYGRRVRNSVAWVCKESDENEQILRMLAVGALQYFLEPEKANPNLGKEIDEAVQFSEGNYGFKVSSQKIKQLIDKTGKAESKLLEKEQPQITDNWDDALKKLVDVLKQYSLPKRDGVLVVVTGLQTEETLKNAGVWWGIARKLVKESPETTPSAPPALFKKLIWAASFVAGVVLVLWILSQVVYQQKFSDVPSTYWAHRFIVELHSKGVVKDFENGEFKPEKHVIRAEFAVMLSEAFEKKATQNAIKIEDVKPNFWAYTAIKEATQTGFLTGNPDNKFKPNEPVTRVYVLVALANGLDLENPAEPDKILKTFYQDEDKIPNDAKIKVAAATKAGLVVNHPDIKLLKPMEPATRAEVAAFIYQALVYDQKAKKINSEFIVQPNRIPPS